MNLRSFLLALTLFIVVALAAIVWVYPSSGDFRKENPFWNGVADFARQFEAIPLGSFVDLPAASQDTVLVVIPCVPFTDTELDTLSGYVSSGGMLLLLDDYGYGNGILRHLGLEVAFSGEPLLDPLFNHRNKWFPRVTDFSSQTVAGEIESIVLNHATSLSGVPSGSVICQSSRFSFLDSNGNAAWDEGEVTGPLPVAAAVEVGQGLIVLVADPSILINSMEGMDGNRDFLKAVTEIRSSSPQVLVDQSHLPRASLDEAKEVLASLRTTLEQPLILLGIVVMVVMLALRPIWRGRKGGTID